MSDAKSAPGRWQGKVDALIRLAEDQRGTPEGDLAREKLLQILEDHPETTQYQPLQDLARRDITLGDLGWMREHGVSTEGSWTGRNLEEAIARMTEEYTRRMALRKRWKAVGLLSEKFSI